MLDSVVRRLAWLRCQLCRFFRFSEQTARAYGLKRQQHQLLLGISGHTGRGWATISEHVEFLQERHNSLVELVDRAAERKLVYKEQDFDDRRFIRVRLAHRARTTLDKLASRHRQELARLRSQLLITGKIWPRTSSRRAGPHASHA